MLTSTSCVLANLLPSRRSHMLRAASTYGATSIKKREFDENNLEASLDRGVDGRRRE